MPYSLFDLNQMEQSAFTEALGEIFEQTPTIASQAWEQRPFTDVDDLHQKMLTVVNAMSDEQQFALICAHPDLGSKAKMAEASTQEQAGAGLDRLTAEEYDRFHRLNEQYKSQFGFPFIIAVKNHTKTSILEAFETRLQHSQPDEMRQAIAEISQIAYFRLLQQVTV
ncbi:2-oxo-4-hydroxy-4-carboxy-5-ureidoimidazoline decarboxylase [Leptolyngbya sp. NIES-2104]|uniref:2-oxo-4-hydroxy-4-carboxy-5-ureidoimidazoline decarboxylase n=1 Tax=Leptolyngbya sp. NIES-2104 TaxID=1552121 RepID=UPI0006EC883C|nr:2-oxo-4-hydroxy-4-carboxy-5-ureidoimidazoline decarboxylase [Leptolyngbya sp. NIES-2104]GAP96373.1 2-oxo-4-hydroxy-4-carboxy--5-ureidoimidazoline (OHCU) decarboxylase [Leptolyngbya sp. NIES-2104]